jgi:hypothetical protein
VNTIESRRCLWSSYLVGGLETAVSDLRHAKLLVVGLLRRDNRSVGDQREVNPRIGDQIRLELRQIHVQRSVKPQRGRNRGHNLPDQAVEVGVGGPIDVQITATDVVDGLVVDHEGAVGMLQGGVGGQDGVVRLHHGSGHLWIESVIMKQTYYHLATSCNVARFSVFERYGMYIRTQRPTGTL